MSQALSSKSLSRNGLILAAVQVILAVSVAGKFTYDRATLPRVWVQASPVDPIMPLRGRYVQMRLKVRLAGPDTTRVPEGGHVRLAIENGELVGRTLRDANQSQGHLLFDRPDTPGFGHQLAEPVVYFIPPGVPDPSSRQPGEELWAEVSVPEAGLPRPVRLGVKKDGKITPLPLQ